MARKFKFLREGLKSDYDGFQWRIGKWHKTECIRLCHGYNCSEKILDALSYVQGEILAEVEVKGKHFTGDDKSTHESMRIIRAWKWTKEDSVLLAIFSAELVIGNYEGRYPADDQPRKAIDAAKAWIINPSKKTRFAAWSAAESAARSAESAAWSARSAARSAESAAWSAARSAARSAESAAWSARSAARSAESAAEDKINNWLISHLDEMEEWTP